MSSRPLPINTFSPLPDRVQRDSLVQQAMTRMRNTRRTLPWEVVADTLTESSLRPKWSGYCATYRAEVMYGAVTGYDRLLARVDSWRGRSTGKGVAVARFRKKTLVKVMWRGSDQQTRSSSSRGEADRAAEGSARRGGQEASPQDQADRAGWGQPQKEAHRVGT